MPVAVTVATPVFEDCQLDCVVTVGVVLFDITAVAVNCAESPTLADDAGAVTVTEESDTAAGGQASCPRAS